MPRPLTSAGSLAQASRIYTAPTTACRDRGAAARRAGGLDSPATRDLYPARLVREHEERAQQAASDLDIRAHQAGAADHRRWRRWLAAHATDVARHRPPGGRRSASGRLDADALRADEHRGPPDRTLSARADRPELSPERAREAPAPRDDSTGFRLAYGSHRSFRPRERARTFVGRLALSATGGGLSITRAPPQGLLRARTLEDDDRAAGDNLAVSQLPHNERAPEIEADTEVTHVRRRDR
jgi:hypothetical protein